MKYALVTGSTRGIGLAIARCLIANDFFVFLNYASTQPDESRFDFSSENYAVIKADLSSMDGVDYLTQKVKEKTERLDCIVLNAATTCKKPLLEIEYEDWQKVMDVNVNMPFFVIRNLYNNISEGGSIIFISAMLGIKPHGISIPYGVSKAAFNMLAQNLIKELAGKKIRVNTICPGFINTEWHDTKPAWLREKIENKIALRRFGQPEDVAAMCLSLIENKYINGAVVAVDGGYDVE